MSQCVFGPVLGYDGLDPLFANLAGKLEPVMGADCEAVASKSTLNRLEHTPKRQGAKYHKIERNTEEVDALLFEDRSFFDGP